MLHMRVSVMELGRFTAGTGRQRSGQSWQRLIILYPEEGINEAKGQWESRGDSRPRLSGGAKLRWVRLGKICRAALDRTAEGGCPHVVFGLRVGAGLAQSQILEHAHAFFQHRRILRDLAVGRKFVDQKGQ